MSHNAVKLLFVLVVFLVIFGGIQSGKPRDQKNQGSSGPSDQRSRSAPGPARSSSPSARPARSLSAGAAETLRTFQRSLTPKKWRQYARQLSGEAKKATGGSPPRGTGSGGSGASSPVDETALYLKRRGPRNLRLRDFLVTMTGNFNCPDPRLIDPNTPGYAETLARANEMCYQLFGFIATEFVEMEVGNCSKAKHGECKDGYCKAMYQASDMRWYYLELLECINKIVTEFEGAADRK